MCDRAGLLLSLLVGNNLTHYVVTSIVTYLLLSQVEVAPKAELYATLITAPMLFVFAELIPKNIFFYRADYLMACFAPVLYAFHTLFTWCGVVPLLKFMSRIFIYLTGSPIPSKTMISTVQRHHIRAVFADIREEGILSPVQADIINRLVDISNIALRAVMTPIKQVVMVDVNSDRQALLKIVKRYSFTRILVYEGQPVNILGFVNIYEALSSPERFSNLHKFVEPIRRLRANATVISAIDIMRQEKQKIALVTRMGGARKEKSVGIVTMKDLVEELLGELAEW